MMRAYILAVAAITCGFLPVAAEAKAARTAVTIAPRYLSAGTKASPYEYRGAVAQADARFLPVTQSIEGRFGEWRHDPWLLPYKRSSFSFDFDGWSGQRRYHRYGY
jgi:hypothetical protein